MNILETSYKLRIFYYSYVQDYIYKIGKTNYHLQVRMLPQSALVHTLSWSVDRLIAVPHPTRAHCQPPFASLLIIPPHPQPLKINQLVYIITHKKFTFDYKIYNTPPPLQKLQTNPWNPKNG